MRVRRVLRILSAAAGLGVLAPGGVGAASFQRLGNLPQAGQGIPLGVSADGSVVVGQAAIDSSFRWDAVNGAVPLEPIFGDIFGVVALAVSGDGSIAVGQGIAPLSSVTYAVQWQGTFGPVALPPLTPLPGFHSTRS